MQQLPNPSLNGLYPFVIAIRRAQVRPFLPVRKGFIDTLALILAH